MNYRAGGTVDDTNDVDSLTQKLNTALNEMNNFSKQSEDAEVALLNLQITNAEQLYRKRIELLNREKVAKENIENKVNIRILELKQKAVDKALREERKKAAKAGRKLSPDEEKDIIAKTEQKFKVEAKTREKLEKAYEKQQKQKENKERNATLRAEQAAVTQGLSGKGLTFTERKEALKNAFFEHDSDGNRTNLNVLKGLTELTGAIADIAKQLDGTIEEIAGNKTAIDTRLYGSRAATKGGSYWDQLSSDISKNIGASPWVKQSAVVANLKTMVSSGIAFNVEQRAFIETIKTSIADTFNANNEVLKKLVRIQQEDTTAARLGMESALTAFLNNMYETTEYMTQQADAIRTSIAEASSLMTAKTATEFEYQIQKWMGSLYSVGFDNASGLSGALGKLAAGDISSISSGGFGNLLVMAANKANMSVADILANGLDASDTNKLMTAVVEYLGEIYVETKGSNILAQQYAGVFGLTASELKAAANLSNSINTISGNSLNYNGMLSELSYRADTIYQRTSLGQKLSNIWDNTKYTIAGGIANNPAAYAIWKVASILDSVAGGINLPIYTPMGSLNTNLNVSDLLQTGLLGTSLLGNIGTLVSGLGTSGSGLLTKFGIGNDVVLTRGDGLNSRLLKRSGLTTGDSGYSGNSDGSNVYKKTMQDTADDANNQISASEEESEDKTLNDVDASIIKIYDLLATVISDGNVQIKMNTGDIWETMVQNSQWK